MRNNTAQIINHTHWDREWFLTSVYTDQWIAGLIDRIQALVEHNPDFHYFLDGQTLVIEDLLRIAPQYREKVEILARKGNLILGPYYCQPDWRLASGEALLRNLLWGRQDTQQFGSTAGAGWLVDTFGHISQAPQLHRLFEIQSVYIWRGAPQLVPYFTWQGADGSRLFAINLFGGYRNLYGVTHAPEIAAKRLQSEMRKLQPYYPSAEIPLFDGYDLEDDPEDPLRFYQDHRSQLPAEIEVQEATPASFAGRLRARLQDLGVISGELLSGKYGAVFPGTLSTRTYLKLMARDCEQLLYQVCEPLGTLARLKGRPYPAEQYEAWSRALLQNAVHDCICGVSIDQVHEKMEYSYRQLFVEMRLDVRRSLAYLLSDFAPGKYAVSTDPFPYEGWQVAWDRLYHIRTNGVGVWKINQSLPVERRNESLKSFFWKNQFYEARVNPGGTVQVGEAILGAIRIFEEKGDAYTGEAGPQLGVLQPNGSLILEQRSDIHSIIRIACSASWGTHQVSAVVRLTFDQSPLVRWNIELDSCGTDFRVELIFEMRHAGQVYAGMPFDVVQRPNIDRDLLPRQLEAGLASILLGQRELGEVRTFPFHDFVAISDGLTTSAILAKGLHSYQADEDGRIEITLRRAVEWLTRTELISRVGDAGPAFYVPDARCERKVVHEIAWLLVDSEIDEQGFQALNAGFQNPPLVVQSEAGGRESEWMFWQENLPLSSLQVVDGRTLARVFNPSGRAQALSKAYLQTDFAGNSIGTVMEVPAKSIFTLAVGDSLLLRKNPGAIVRVANLPAWRVGANHGLPDQATIDLIKEKDDRLGKEIEKIEAEISRATPPDSYSLQHQSFALQRQLVEYRLSARLNEIKLARGGRLDYDYLFQPDEEIAALGRALNQLRIKRRIYDYIVQAI